ncbi:hypothetical protein NSER024013_04530 [Nocardia seriolae]|nr:hypothetical protein NSER024013_04530 [Nocardia seriolae]
MRKGAGSASTIGCTAGGTGAGVLVVVVGLAEVLVVDGAPVRDCVVIEVLAAAPVLPESSPRIAKTRPTTRSSSTSPPAISTMGDRQIGRRVPGGGAPHGCGGTPGGENPGPGCCHP